MPNLKRGFRLIELLIVIVIIGLLAALAIPKVQAQDAPPPVITAPTINDAPPANILSRGLELFAPILTATNWVFGGYGMYDMASHKIGGGIGALYNVNNYVGAWMRAEYNGNDFSGGSGSLALQLPIAILGGKAYLTPNVYTGAQLTLAGLGKNNGTPQGIFGAGFGVSSGNWRFFTEYEQRTAEADKILAGFGYSF